MAVLWITFLNNTINMFMRFYIFVINKTTKKWPFNEWECVVLIEN